MITFVLINLIKNIEISLFILLIINIMKEPILFYKTKTDINSKSKNPIYYWKM